MFCSSFFLYFWSWLVIIYTSVYYHLYNIIISYFSKIFKNYAQYRVFDQIRTKQIKTRKLRTILIEKVVIYNFDVFLQNQKSEFPFGSIDLLGSEVIWLHFYIFNIVQIYGIFLASNIFLYYQQAKCMFKVIKEAIDHDTKNVHS